MIDLIKHYIPNIKTIGFLSDMAYSSFKEYPYDGQDWGYLVWRKSNCCAL